MPPERSVDAYPGAEPLEEPHRAEVGELLDWLSTADLPHESFQLRPWLNVVDVARFAATLKAELSREVIDPRWRTAAEDLRELTRVYGRLGDGQPQRPSQLGRAPPLTGSPALMSELSQPVTRQDAIGGSRVG